MRARTCNRTQWFTKISFHNRSYPAPKVRTYITDGLSRWAGPRSVKAPSAPSLPPHPGRPGLLTPPLKGNAFFACLEVSVARSIYHKKEKKNRSLETGLERHPPTPPLPTDSVGKLPGRERIPSIVSSELRAQEGLAGSLSSVPTSSARSSFSRSASSGFSETLADSAKHGVEKVMGAEWNKGTLLAAGGTHTRIHSHTLTPHPMG